MYTVTKLYLEKKQTDQGETVTVTGGYATTKNGIIKTSHNDYTGKRMLDVFNDKMSAQKMADYHNGKVMEFPKVHTAALKAAFKTTESTWNPGWYYVSDKTSEYLFRRLGIRGTDWYEVNIMDTFRVAICWRMQKWVVSA